MGIYVTPNYHIGSNTPKVLMFTLHATLKKVSKALRIFFLNSRSDLSVAYGVSKSAKNVSKYSFVHQKLAKIVDF